MNCHISGLIRGATSAAIGSIDEVASAYPSSRPMGRGCSKAAIELGLDWQTIEQSVHFIVAMAEANRASASSAQSDISRDVGCRRMRQRLSKYAWPVPPDAHENRRS